MADYHAITAIGRAILSLLENACPRDEFEKAEFKLYKSDNFEKPMAEGVSLYLYRVGTSSRRNLPPRRDQSGNTLRPPLPLDLYYLLTAWAESAEKQQFLLGWSLSELNDNPILPATLLNHYFKPKTGNVFLEDEEIALTFDPLSLQDLANLWEPLKPNLQASAGYVARMVAIDSRIPIRKYGLIQTREFDFVAGDRP